MCQLFVVQCVGHWKKGKVNPGEVAGIGIDGQRLVWRFRWTRTGEVLTNTPIRMDTRAADICEEVGREVGEDRILKCAGNPFKTECIQHHQRFCGIRNIYRMYKEDL